MADNKQVDKAIEAVINLASALGILEKELISVLEEGIIFDNDGQYSDKTLDIVNDLVNSPEFEIINIKKMEVKPKMADKYIIKSFKENGEFVGCLSAFSASGYNQFAPQLKQAILFDKEEECIYSNGQTWQEGRSDEKGYYEISKVIEL